MAILDLDVGSAANANDGATLRDAFINVRKMMYEIYGVSTNPSDVLDSYTDELNLATGSQTFKESVQDIVGGMFTGNTLTNITATYQDSDGTIDLVVAADITDINTAANSGLAGGVDSGDATLTLDLNNLTAAAVDVSADSIGIIDANDSNGTRKESIADLATAMSGSDLNATSGQFSIADNVVDHDELANRYTEDVDITTYSGAVTFDCSTGSVFKLGDDLAGAYTITLSNHKKGQIITIYPIKGDQTLNLSTASGTPTFNKIGGINYEDNGTSSNILQIECVDDASNSVFFYSLATFAADKDDI